MVEENNLCPVCNGSTQKVNSITVKHFVLDNLLEGIKDDDNYFICLNKDCDIVYFNNNQDILINKDEIKIPIWFKEDANPKYICYCNHVTEQQIIHAVLNENAKNMKDIIRLTGAMKNGKCEINNPLGKCCGPIIEETIKKALDMKEKNKL